MYMRYMRKLIRRIFKSKPSPDEQALFAMFKTVPLATITEVRFYKRDEWTTDLICCEIATDEKTWFFHEETDVWEPLMDCLKRLGGFDHNWISKVTNPAFKTCLYVAYRR